MVENQQEYEQRREAFKNNIIHRMDVIVQVSRKRKPATLTTSTPQNATQVSPDRPTPFETIRTRLSLPARLACF